MFGIRGHGSRVHGTQEAHDSIQLTGRNNSAAGRDPRERSRVSGIAVVKFSRRASIRVKRAEHCGLLGMICGGCPRVHV